MKIEIVVFGQTGVFIPAICGEVVFETSLNGCGSLKFRAMKEGELDFKEGNCVVALCDGEMFFKGYVFEKHRDKQGIISAVCYDQLRYFKNKDCFTYYNKQASELLKMLADDYRLKTGEIESTGYVIPYRIEDNATLFDVMYNALSLTKQYTGREYVLFDNCGEICLKNCVNLKCDYFICAENLIDFEYTSSIDRDTYNRIKLVHSDKRSGIYNVYRAENADAIKRFGMLQYYSHISEEVNGTQRANELLKQHNRVGRLLRVKALGDLRLRAGSVVRVNLDLGDFTLNCNMKCSNVQHFLHNQSHIMSLTLKGGEFVYE